MTICPTCGFGVQAHGCSAGACRTGDVDDDRALCQTCTAQRDAARRAGMHGFTLCEACAGRGASIHAANNNAGPKTSDLGAGGGVRILGHRVNDAGEEMFTIQPYGPVAKPANAQMANVNGVLSVRSGDGPWMPYSVAAVLAPELESLLRETMDRRSAHYAGPFWEERDALLARLDEARKAGG